MRMLKMSNPRESDCQVFEIQKMTANKKILLNDVLAIRSRENKGEVMPIFLVLIIFIVIALIAMWVLKGKEDK